MLNEKLIGDCQDINDNRSGILNHERTHIKIVGFTFHYKRKAEISVSGKFLAEDRRSTAESRRKLFLCDLTLRNSAKLCEKYSFLNK